jgi:serine protease
LDITRGSASVIVAVVDTGVLLGHPDLQGQLIDGFDFVKDPIAARDGDGLDANPNDPGDGSTGNAFHGTHVAGTIAAASNNSLGVAGIAPGVKIMPVRVLGSVGSSYDVVQGVRYAAGLPNDSGRVPAKRADIINLSLGNTTPLQAEQDLYTAVRQQGVIVVAAAGNNASSVPFYPASYNNVISVSATSLRKTLSSYSNFGSNVDVAAPGGDSGDFDGDGNQDLVLSTCGDNKNGTISFTYCYLNGTSMATPHVAGVIALMKSVNSTGVTPDSVDQLLAAGKLTEDIGASGRDNNFGYGLIDARKALNAAQGAAPPATPTLVATPKSLNFNAADSALDLLISNSGGGALQVTALTPSVAWITVTRGTVDANGVGRYAVRVTRTGMSDGLYSAQIDVASNAGTLRVPIVVQVRSGAAAGGNAGYHYVLLIKSDSDETAYEVPVAVNNGVYTYRFDDIASGTYELVAGTDADNDEIICDEGEACGAYLTIDQPTLINVDRNRTAMDFVSGFDVSIRSQAVGADEPNPPRVLRRLPRGSAK